MVPFNSNFSPLCLHDTLFEEVASFYAWYAAWDQAPQDHADTYQLLAQLMKISLLSQQGGCYLSPLEEETSRAALKQLKEKLYDCRVKAADIPAHIGSIYEKLTQNNSKARLVGTLAQLECLLAPNREIQRLCQGIASKVTRSFPDQSASAITHNLSKILDEPLKYKNLNTAIQDALRGWL
jgi:hypothetical protein